MAEFGGEELAAATTAAAKAIWDDEQRELAEMWKPTPGVEHGSMTVAGPPKLADGYDQPAMRWPPSDPSTHLRRGGVAARAVLAALDVVPAAEYERERERAEKWSRDCVEQAVHRSRAEAELEALKARIRASDSARKGARRALGFDE